MNVTVAIRQRGQVGRTLVWTTLGLGRHSRVLSGKSAVKLQKER